MESEGSLPTKFKLIGASRKNYPELPGLIKQAEAELGEDTQKIYYFAVPPQATKDVLDFLSASALIDGKCKVLLEKPFGKSFSDAQELIAYFDKHLSEDQIFRVDHYLAKNSLQKISSTEWKRGDIKKIEVIASEKIDIEGRVNFYEQTGALHDFVQSHLLEIAAHTLKDPGNVRDERAKALKNLEVICDITKGECVKRGQYIGYRDEVANPESMTETFVYINMASNDPSWRGIDIVLTTGKAMKEKRTQVRVTYKNGEITTFNIEHEPDAYQRVIIAAILGNRDLFISSDEVLESWRILDTIQMTWKGSSDNLIFYPKGSDIEKIN
jgi:glucose-6-phosphate 1-dehydrogenase